MDARELLDEVRDDNGTALSRLGSSKALYAATGGEMDAEHVLAAAADDAAAARKTFDAWTDEGGRPGSAFAAATAAAERQLETVRGEIGGDYEPDAGDSLHEDLRDLDGAVARVGGLLGWALVSGETLDQVVGFFVGDADPRTASTFRDVRSETDAVREEALDALDDVCDGDDDWETAKEAADGAVQAAYDDYVEALEGMGVNPKNVC